MNQDVPAISDITATNLGAFAREAQAAYLLDRVMLGMKITDATEQYTELIKVDVELRSLSSILMIQSSRVLQPRLFCGGIAITIR